MLGRCGDYVHPRGVIMRNPDRPGGGRDGWSYRRRSTSSTSRMTMIATTSPLIMISHAPLFIGSQVPLRGAVNLSACLVRRTGWAGAPQGAAESDPGESAEFVRLRESHPIWMSGEN
jgi:hypothetical protein